jgi:hypothetical protein
MNWILKAKHWQIFLLLFLFEIMASIDFQGDLRNLYWINLIGISVFLIWLFFLTNELIKIVPKAYGLNINLYYVNAILFFAVYFSAMYLNNGNDVSFNGIYALIGFYIFYAFLQSFGFAGRIIKSMELHRKSKKRESIGYFFLFIFLPIGIWFMQPKINKLNKNRAEENILTANTV